MVDRVGIVSWDIDRQDPGPLDERGAKMTFASFSVVAWLVSTVLCMGLGALWYGPLFGRAWMAAVGLSKEAIKPTPAPFIASAIAWLLASGIYALMVGATGAAGFADLILLAVLLWAGFAASPIRLICWH